MDRYDLAATLNHLNELAVSRRISRRQLLRRAAALGLSAPTIALLLAACGGDDEEAVSTPAQPAVAAPTPTVATSPRTSPGATPTTTTARPAQNQTLIYPWANEARTLDPGNAAEAGSLDVVSNCYEPLVAMVPRSADLEPRLAKSWDISPDAQVFTFKLQEGVKFVDGTLMDATAVKKSFERTIQMNLGPATPLQIVDRIEAVDQLTVRFTLKEPNAYFIENLTQQYVVSPTAVEKNDRGGDLAATWFEAGNTAGTGPFNMTEFRKNETKTMVRFPDYWRGWDGNHLEQIVCPIVPEEATRRQMIERGDSHYSRQFSPDHLAGLQESPAAVVEFLESYWLWTKPLNMAKPPTDNLKVRQAIQYAFPYEQFAQQAWRGWARVPNGPIPQGFPGFDESLPLFKQDLEKARQLVAESGLTSIVVDSFFTETLTVQREMETALQDVLRGLGVEMQVQAVPWSTQFDSMHSRDLFANMSNVIIGPTRPDPAFALEWMFGSQLLGKPYNWSYYSNPKVDELIVQARKTLDREQSEQYLREASRLIVEDSPVLWYGLPDRVDAYSAKVQNFTPITIGFLYETKWYDAWLAE